MDSKKIRVNSGIVIEVNDNGDTIIMNADDQEFIDKFYDLIDRIEQMKKQVEEAGFRTKSEREKHKYMMDNTKDIIMTDIDALFGAGTCQKVFGNIIPSAYLIAEFFDQLIPIAKKYANDRQQAISSKYNRNRKGKKNRYRTKEEIIQNIME